MARWLCVLLLACPAHADAQAWIAAVDFGPNVSSAGSRFGSTDPGYAVEAMLGFPLGSSWHAGAGASWGTFGADVPEFDVFAPLDHPAWLEYTSMFAFVRTRLGRAAAVEPFLEGRIGWNRELAEFSGATIRRSGFALGGAAGLEWRVLSRIGLRLVASATTAGLGSGDVGGFDASASRSRATYAKLTGGFFFRLGG